jgi:hypothetical protein
MGSIAAELSALAGMLGLLAFLLFCTLKINRNRKVRTRRRRLTDRLMNWK